MVLNIYLFGNQNRSLKKNYKYKVKEKEILLFLFCMNLTQIFQVEKHLQNDDDDGDDDDLKLYHFPFFIYYIVTCLQQIPPVT